ncbi:MAG: DMT family transporter [Ignavibacteriota bacterium]|jgi:drug/metabolite transporter (DMT)-like permease|nr:MAG: DMT family transporter [Chlorobiota bacterium]MBE7475860.1 DMT family transporter [Ignavibacteriales bacterium]MBL1123332.1 DMT family transporter [Ignavibacteriota bacterium]MCC7092975.1 DMT family transporter [Ignavibacteriaceae bacterium]MCE7856533.1 DMT family transporter [Ignavibacteria bacterium CHB3]MEB2295462.1 DMT family transporter [Ignavibacteria bacterium]
MNSDKNQLSIKNNLSPLFVIIAASLWGVDGIVLRPALFSLPVPLVVFVESTIVAILLSPYFIRHLPSLKFLKTKDWLAFFLLALFGGAIGTMAITKALFYVNFVNLSVVILLQKLQPVFAIALASVFLKEKLSFRFIFWAGIAIVGAYFMTFGTNLPDFSTGDKTTVAAIFSLLAALSFSASTVLSKRALRNVSFGMGTYLRFLFSAVIMLVIVVFIGDTKNIPDITATQIIVFLIIALTTGGTAIFLYYYGLKRISASVATICELAFPFTAIILEYFLRGNILDIVQWIGAVILLISILKVSGINFSGN